MLCDLVTAPIAVTDLTDSNPNVYWELGVRQSFKHGTITIAEDGTTLPFDLGGKGTLFYFPGDHIKMQEFENKFHEAIDDCSKNPDLPDSHVLETISGRGTLHQILMRDESLRKLDALISEIEDNIVCSKNVEGVCKRNIEKEKEALAKSEQPKRDYCSVRFRLIAVEMLIINRYIDASEIFYKTAEDYMDWLASVNEQLSFWQSKPKTTESWLLKVNDDIKSRINKFRALVKEQKKTIETIL